MKKKISIDKWELAFNSSEETKLKLESNNTLVFNNFILNKINQNNDYKNNFEIILNNGDLFGTLYFGSYRINRNKIYIMVNNKMLYSKEELLHLYDIQRELDIEFDINSKLDIALDFDYNIINKFYKLIKCEDINLIILNTKYGIDDEIGELLNMSTGTRKNIHKYKSFYIQNKEKRISS